MPKIVKLSPYQLHRKRWINCTRCPLCETRKEVVLYRGWIDRERIPCDVLFVGEAPGTSENTLGKPFIGPAGKLLDRAIEDAGGDVERIRLGFTNTLACIPLDEDGRKVSEVEDWPKEALLRCSPRLLELIEVAEPLKIVAVGVIAEKHLKKLSVNIDAEILHPAAILRANPAQQGLMYQRTVVALREVFESLIPF